ncbi:uncharacterized protein LOC130902302 [Diorhabda carinulata]|uniref:uncharacterized protein LOC130902302 n=1 Tax=Diorhabda carinulata TaxID=1163345 RepID=UPI00259FE600|nr:uncharacterized protein LOC130902302 [Diorhabda carinulata]
MRFKKKSNFNSSNTVNVSTTESNNSKKDISIDIVAQRILYKHSEIAENKKSVNSKLHIPHTKTSQELNDLIVRRILETDAKLNKKNTSSMFKVIDKNRSNEIEMLSRSKPINLIENTDTLASSSTDKRNRIRILSTATQTLHDWVNLETDSTQTETDLVNERNIQVDWYNDYKNIQTSAETKNMETSPVIRKTSCKFTNTDFYYPAVSESTQIFEYMSNSDLFCLEWVDKYLFNINLNIQTVVVDEKIRDIYCLSSCLSVNISM